MPNTKFDHQQVVYTRGSILKETHYYPFGLTMNGISCKALNFGEPENKKKFNSIEYENSFDISIGETFFRTHESQIGRWWQIDPKPTHGESPYVAMGNNPIRYADLLGDIIVDKNGKEVKVIVDENGKTKYEFDKSYTAKQLSKVQKQFNKNAGMVINAMAASEQGRKDITTLSTISTKVTINPTIARNSVANSSFSPGENGEKNADGYYKSVNITPFMGNFHLNKKGKLDLNEWLGAVMTVETGHAELEGIKLSEEAQKNNPGYLGQPDSKEFISVYTPLLNRATSLIISYRDAIRKVLGKEVFAPLDSYPSIPYSESNARRKEELQKQEQ